MIHSLTANYPSFKALTFTTGLNLILADRTVESTDRDTRNGLGKTTLIDILHFCLGSRVVQNRALFVEPLHGWEFTLEVTIAGDRIRVTRAIDNPRVVAIEGPTSGWLHPREDGLFSYDTLTIDQWTTSLGHALFGLTSRHDDAQYGPTFRSLMSYFMRRGNDAYLDPFRYFRHQPPWNVQVNVGFLLGLNWEHASRWQQIKDREKQIRDREKELISRPTAIRTAIAESSFSSIGELEAQLIEIENQMEGESGELKSFRVHPQYAAIERDANRITEVIHHLTNENMMERRRLARYRASIANENPPSEHSIDDIYEESRAVFSESSRRTIAEAREFHSKIIANRRAFLETEMGRLGRSIEARAGTIKELIESNAASLDILRTHGALEAMTRLQERHADTRDRWNRVRARIAEIRDLVSQKHEIRIAREELAQIADRDRDQRREIWSVPTRLFNENSHALYERPGHLVIDVVDSGFKYEVEISRGDSEGIGRMKIFCFDLMLMQLMSHRRSPLDFLVHDSVLYDGVDSRQRAIALELANSLADENGTQYICALNSDMVPREDFSDSFDVDQHVRLTLTDAEPSGTLLGFQYERVE